MLAERYRLHTEQSNEVRGGCEAVNHRKEDHIVFPDIDYIYESAVLNGVLR
jgi:hypothetical protein